MYRELSAKPNLEHLKYQAKELLTLSNRAIPRRWNASLRCPHPRPPSRNSPMPYMWWRMSTVSQLAEAEGALGIADARSFACPTTHRGDSA